MITFDRSRDLPIRERHPRGASDVRNATPWLCSIAPNPPGALLILEYRGPAGSHLVDVLLDGVPAADHPTVYVASDAPAVMTAGAEVDYHFVLTGGQPQFDAVEILWTDADGRPQRYATDARTASGPADPDAASA